MHIEIRGNTLCLSETVTMATFREHDYQNFYQCLQTKQISQIDVSGLTEADSACVALLIAARRFASHQAMTLSFTGIPEGLTMLMDLYGVENWMQ